MIMTIQTKMLRESQVRNDPKDFERVLPVLDRRLYDGGDCGVVLRAGFRAEASADLEFGLGGPERLLAVVVRGWDIRIGKECEYSVPVLCDAFLERVKLGILPVVPGIYGRPRKQSVEPFLHLRPHVRPRIPCIPPMHGVPEEIHHIQTPGVVRESLHRICEIAQQVGDTDLVIVHSHLAHEVGRPAVRDPYGPALLLAREVPVHHIVAAASVKSQICRDTVLESPEPAVLAVHIDSRLVSSGDLAVRDLLPDRLIWGLGNFPHRVQHVGDGALADMETEDGLQQVSEPFERDVLIGAEVRHQGQYVRAVGNGSVDLLREKSLAAVSAGAFHLHLEMVNHLRHNGQRYVHDLPSRALRGGVHIQRLPAYGTRSRRIPSLRAGHVLGPEPRAALVSDLTAGLPAGRLALRLRMRNADRIFGRRDAAVGTGLHDRLGTALKFRDARFQPFDLLFHLENVPVQRVNHKTLLMQLLCQFGGVQVLGL